MCLNSQVNTKLEGNSMKHTLLIGMALLLALAACTAQPLNGENATSNHTPISMENDTAPTEEPVLNTTNETSTPSDSQYAARVRATEGDFIQLNTRAVDPDGGEVTLSFQSPFNNEGQWQTEVGDAGEYDVRITASDGREETTITIQVIVDELNLPPSIQGPDVIEVDEGERINLNIYNITDPEGDELVVSYSGWMSSSTRTTDFGDAGEYTVRIIAEDTAGNEVFKEVTIIVNHVNRPPVLTIEETTIVATEGDRVRIRASAEDPDGDDVNISYEQPFNQQGIWVSEVGDEGTYTITVTATDGVDTVSEEVTVTLERRNRPPVIIVDDPIIVNEGETLDLNDYLTITDPDGGEVDVTFSGWMNTSTRELGFEDAGTYTVTVTATDEDDLVTRVDLNVEVRDVNRPPVFVIPA